MREAARNGCWQLWLLLLLLGILALFKFSPVVQGPHGSALGGFPPRLLPGALSCCLALQWQCSPSPWCFLGDLMYCEAPAVTSSDQRPRFCGVSSHLQPSVCCPCEATSQVGPRPL